MPDAWLAFVKDDKGVEKRQVNLTMLTSYLQYHHIWMIHHLWAESFVL